MVKSDGRNVKLVNSFQSMKIAIIADTHLKKDTGQLDRLMVEFGRTDVVIHAGDYGETWVLDYFQKHFNFSGVWGNTDNAAIRSRVPEKQIVKAGPYRLGVCHGHGQGKTTAERAYAHFAGDPVDIIIFGHSHQPMIYTKNKVLMLNPGSLTSKRRERWFSYIILTVGVSGLKPELTFLEVLP